jgi:cold shock CspA family protein
LGTASRPKPAVPEVGTVLAGDEQAGFFSPARLPVENDLGDAGGAVGGCTVMAAGRAEALFRAPISAAETLDSETALRQPSGTMTETEQLPFRGRVKNWKHAFGYGFIIRDGDHRDIFCHVTVLKEAGIAAVLAAGDRVSFAAGPDARGRLRITKLAIDALRPAAVD